MKKIDVACFQLCSSESVEKNIVMIDRMFDSIEKKLDLVCLPECTAIFTESKKLDLVKKLPLFQYFSFQLYQSLLVL